MTDQSTTSAETLKALLRELTALDGVAGHEQPVVARLHELFRPVVDRIEIDSHGNLVATKDGPAGSPSLMLSAHSDEIGGVVKSIDPSGLIRFERAGGIIESLMIGRHVRIRGYRGVVGVKSGHLQSPEERGRVPSLADLYIDFGFESEDDVRRLGIRVGDAIAYDQPLAELANPDRVSGKAIDNRIFCAILVLAARRLAAESLKATIHYVVTVQEEVGLRGAAMAAFRVNPTAAIVFDTAPSGGTPDVDFYRDLNVRSGRGPVIALGSGNSMRGHLIHPGMRDFLRTVAAENEIAVQEAMFSGGTSDASTIHLVRGGIPTGAVKLSRRYSHSPVETLDMNDAVAALRLVEGAARSFGPETKLDFLESAWG